MPIIEIEFLKSLFITVTIETIVIYLLVYRESFKRSTKLLSGTIPTITTLPYIWFVFPYFINNRLIYTILSESFAVLFEAVIIYLILRVKFRYAFLLSFVANTVSYLFGLVFI